MEATKEEVEKFFGKEFEIIDFDKYDIVIKNNKGNILAIDSDCGIGYNEGSSWLEVSLSKSAENGGSE
jgi:hypothetical protein